jgi:hypothetical protein
MESEFKHIESERYIKWLLNIQKRKIHKMIA